jgi:GNAT superfamily N-acetyltransferase
VSVDIQIASEATEELRAALATLLPQLSSSPPPTLDELALITANPESALFVARLEGRIVGSLTLVFYRIPTGLKAWIEDVVVDDAARGRGVGQLLNERALGIAREAGAPTSNPFKVIAGTSAGAIIAAGLACHADRYSEGVAKLVDLWSDFRADQVYRADALGVAQSGARWLSMFTLGWAIARWRRARSTSARPSWASRG